MKRNLLILLLLLTGTIVYAQEFTMEYNAGFGTYKMDNMQNYLAQANMPAAIANIKTTDNFPGYLTHDIRLGVNWKINHLGVLIGYMNTAGQRNVADYSAEYSFRVRPKGVRLGGFYRIAHPEFCNKLISPYFQLSMGMTVTNCNITSQILLKGKGGYTEKDKVKLDNSNFFIEPALGLKIRLHKLFAFNVSAGYSFEGKAYLKESGQKTNLKTDWSGLRVQAGIITYIPL
ncbi:hypothetical protein [Parabacteroides pacaensis]|uniref:hypothetical protein n=1 Tax=Parabacteroides pacaensis TaxID=2086575 RepID=UPI000D10B6F7|nr:hypothetical protein [Parabacteroides pacaensis]